jgi:ribose transport system permease protein
MLLFCFFSITTKTFWSLDNWDNIRNIVLQQAPFTVLLALCMTLSITLRGFDLSIGSSVAVISCVTGYILKWTHAPFLAIPAAVGLGSFIGLANGMLIAKVRVPPFVATYSVQKILRGIALVLLGGKQIYDFGPSFRKIFISQSWTFFAVSALICAAVAVMLSKTVFGQEIYATGINAEAAEISGIRTDRVILKTYAISGVIIGLLSVMYIANLGTAEPVIGEDFPITAIAATLVGGTSIGGGSGKTSNAVIGSLIMLFLTNGMVQMNVPSVWQKVVIGGVIVFSIVIERLLLRFSGDRSNNKYH